MNNLSGSTKGYIDETKVTKDKKLNETKKVKSEVNKTELNDLTKEISEDFFKLLEKCDRLYEMKSLKEIYDLIITVNSAKRDILKLKDI
jgi:hypothetical protein